MKFRMIAVDDEIEDLRTILQSNPQIAEKYEEKERDINSIVLKDKRAEPDGCIMLELYKYPESRAVSEKDARREVINKIERGRYDVVFLDYHLGRASEGARGDVGFQRGLRLVHALAQHFPEMPIIVITAKASLSHAQAPEILACAEIYDKSEDLAEIARILCKSERVIEIMENNSFMHAGQRVDCEKRLPLRVKYDLDTNKIEISGVLRPFSCNYLRSLSVRISYVKIPEGDDGRIYESKEWKYRALFWKRMRIDINKLRSQGVDRISFSVRLGERDLSKAEFRWLVDVGKKPTYLHYLKNIQYINREYLYLSGTTA